MAIYKRKKDGCWQVSYRDEYGKVRTKTFSSGEEGKKAAKAFEAEIKYRKATNKKLTLLSGSTIYLDQLAQEWLDNKKAQGRKLQWLRDWANILNKYILPALAVKPIHKLTQGEIISLINRYWGNASQATRNRYIGYLKSIFQYGVELGYIEKNPLTGWKKGKEERRKSSLTLKVLQEIIKNAPPYLAWAIKVAWNVPVRPGSDLFGLRFDTHVNYERGGFEVFHSKVGRTAFIKCSPTFMEEVKEKEKKHLSGYVIEYKGRPVKEMKRSLKNAAIKAGWKHPICWYDIRHLWITTALDKGIEPSAIAYMTGTSVKMIHQHYYEPLNAEKDKAARILSPLIENPQKSQILPFKKVSI